MDSPIFTCGMAPLDPDDPCFALFHCDPSLECDTHVEPEFYTSRIELTQMKMHGAPTESGTRCVRLKIRSRFQ